MHAVLLRPPQQLQQRGGQPAGAPAPQWSTTIITSHPPCEGCKSCSPKDCPKPFVFGLARLLKADVVCCLPHECSIRAASLLPTPGLTDYKPTCAGHHHCLHRRRRLREAVGRAHAGGDQHAGDGQVPGKQVRLRPLGTGERGSPPLGSPGTGMLRCCWQRVPRAHASHSVYCWLAAAPRLGRLSDHASK